MSTIAIKVKTKDMRNKILERNDTATATPLKARIASITAITKNKIAQSNSMEIPLFIQS